MNEIDERYDVDERFGVMEMFDDEVRSILKRRISIHPEDRIISLIWEELASKLSENEELTINFLSTCSSKEIYYISEVFEDISLNLKSHKFIGELRELEKKFPYIDMRADIELAEEYADY